MTAKENYLQKVTSNFVFRIQESLNISKLEAEQVAGLAIQVFLCKHEDIHINEYLSRLLNAIREARTNDLSQNR